MRYSLKASVLAGAALTLAFGAPAAHALGPFTPERALIERLGGESVTHLPPKYVVGAAADAQRDAIARFGGHVERPSGRGTARSATPSDESERAFIDRLAGTAGPD